MYWIALKMQGPLKYRITGPLSNACCRGLIWGTKQSSPQLMTHAVQLRRLGGNIHWVGTMNGIKGNHVAFQGALGTAR
jgi:hypothetical protein